VNNLATPEELVGRAAVAMRIGPSAMAEAASDAPLPLYATDTEGRVVYSNDACTGFAGRVPEPGNDRWCVTWKLYESNGSPLPHDRCPMAIAVREQREIRGIEAVAERPDGSRVEFLPYPTPVFDEAGSFIGAINVLVDLRARNEARHLSSQATRCRRLAKSISDARTAETLKLMAGEYEQQARTLQETH